MMGDNYVSQEEYERMSDEERRGHNVRRTQEKLEKMRSLGITEEQHRQFEDSIAATFDEIEQELENEEEPVAVHPWPFQAQQPPA